ncbi:MAG: hypothetical protein JWO95_743 [Verrucomicrobiales bacterium]|nr:hypothetical protein [Verrucomicrobiales bacterium]
MSRDGRDGREGCAGKSCTAGMLRVSEGCCWRRAVCVEIDGWGRVGPKRLLVVTNGRKSSLVVANGRNWALTYLSLVRAKVDGQIKCFFKPIPERPARLTGTTRYHPTAEGAATAKLDKHTAGAIFVRGCGPGFTGCLSVHLMRLQWLNVRRHTYVGAGSQFVRAVRL